VSKLLLSITVLGGIILLMQLFNDDHISINNKISKNNEAIEAKKNVSLSKVENTHSLHANGRADKKQQSQSVTMNEQQTKKDIPQQNLDENLNLALSRTPDTYHNIFRWSEEFDAELVSEYALAVSAQEQQLADVSLEQLFNDFIFQHELSVQVEIEVLRCTPSSCEVYGKELSSSAWGVIKDEAKQMSWWPFTMDVTRNAMGTNGEMVFITITR